MSNKIFQAVQSDRPKMSAFDLSREQKLTCNMGELVPTYLEEVVPGDQFSVRSEMLLRFAPMIAPVMHNIDAYMHYFFVPNRLIWDEWEEFISPEDPDATQPIFPHGTLEQLMDVTSGISTALGDYLGLPKTLANTSSQFEVSVLPFRAYQLIFNEYYRDQNLQSDAWFSRASGQITNPERDELTTLRKRAWEKDYFTSAMPTPQRGSEPLVDLGIEYLDQSIYLQQDGTSVFTGGANFSAPDRLQDSAPQNTRVENIDESASGFSINEFRVVNAVQKWLEKSMVGGSRYKEFLKNFFGVDAGDQRLDRPEYLGGGKQPVVISEVLNTTGTVEAPQGDMAGHGISAGLSNTFKSQFKEHGWVMGILSVLPRTVYGQGIHRHWTRDTRYEYYFPEFANLGEQPVRMYEIYGATLDVNKQNAFGYQQRYAEYKYGKSTVHADFQTTLDFWHLSRIFTSEPVLNNTFIEADPSDRIFAVQGAGTDRLWIQLYHDVKARRPMPFFATPRIA